MHTQVRDTSLEAYRDHQATGKLTAQQVRIVDFLDVHRRGYTRHELARETGILLSAVCGRVSELRKLEILVEAPRRTCSVTGKAAHPVRLAPEQLTLV